MRMRLYIVRTESDLKRKKGSARKYVAMAESRAQAITNALARAGVNETVTDVVEFDEDTNAIRVF